MDPVHLHFGLVAFGVCSVLQALGRGDEGCLLAVLTRGKLRYPEQISLCSTGRRCMFPSGGRALGTVGAAKAKALSEHGVPCGG